MANYYGDLQDTDSDPDSSSYSTLRQTLETWADEATAWEDIRQEHLPNTSDLEEEVTFSSRPS